jgi:pimeloyl-ACP methyl ester carboxylesterase
MRQQYFNSILNNQPIRMAYREWGDSANPHTLVCVHGLARQSGDFDLLAEKLSADMRILVPDMPGRGQSTWLTNKNDYHNGHYAVLMAQFLDSLKLYQVDWLGTSMGALIAMVLNHLYPDRIRKLIVNDIGPFIPQSALQRIAKYVDVNPVFQNIEEAAALMQKNYADFGIKQKEHMDQFVANSLNQMADGTFRLHYDQGIAVPFAEAFKGDVSIWPLWDSIKCPTLILRGEKSDVLPLDVFTKMQQLGPHISGITIKDVGHAPALMEDDQIDIVKRFLAG